MIGGIKMSRIREMVILTVLVLTLLFMTGCTSNRAESISLEGNWKIIKQDGEKDIRVLNLTDVRQATGYTCGVSALQTILFYYGIEYREGALAEFAGSDPDAGTPPSGIIKAVERVNQEDGTQFTAEVKQNATIDDLKELIDAETPVIVDIQAWRDEDNKAEWKDDWIDGHYVVAIGYDDENVYFEDPAMMNSIGKIPNQELLDRWHDFEGVGDYDPEKSVKTHNLIIIIKGEQPQMFDTVLHID